MFHLFTTDNCGNPVWLEAVEDLKTANRRLSQLASVNPGEYFVFDLRNHQVPIRLESTGEPERR